MTFGQEVIADTGISLALDELSNLINRLSDQITHLEEENDKFAKELSVLRELSFRMSSLDFARLISAAEKNNEFVVLDDGFYCFWPKANAGAYSSWMLRVLADECDRRNKSWQEDIDLYYKKEEHS